MLKSTNLDLMSRGEKYYNLGFWILIGVTLFQFLHYKYTLSLDGPQHLHNAYVLKDLLLNKGEVRDFYNINPLPVGYWTTHILLTLLTFIFPPWLAEKLLLVIYVLGMALAFRYFLRSVSKKLNPVGLYLIFPLIPSFFILLGYYAFSFGVIMLLVTLGYWNRISRNPGWRDLLKFSLLLLLFYFTHGLVFTFFLAVFLLQYVYETLISLFEEGNFKEGLIEQGGKTVKTVLAFIPSLIFLFIYSRSVLSTQAGIDTITSDFKELLDQLFRISPIIGFHREMEAVYTKPLSLGLMLVVLTIFVRQVLRLWSGRSTIKMIVTDKTNIYLLISLVFLLIFFLNPDRFIAGSMTKRIGFFFFLFLIMWIPFQRIPAMVNLIMGLVVLFAVIYNQTLMPQFYEPQDRLITELQELDPSIKDGSSIYTLKELDNWLNDHFGLYVGLEKHTINLNNPQCYGPFPLIWDREHSSAFFAGKQQVNVAGLGRLDPEKYPSRQVDYLLVFYHDRFLNKEGNEAWQAILEDDYHLVQVSSGGAAGLYEKKD